MIMSSWVIDGHGEQSDVTGKNSKRDVCVLIQCFFSPKILWRRNKNSSCLTMWELGEKNLLIGWNSMSDLQEEKKADKLSYLGIFVQEGV